MPYLRWDQGGGWGFLEFAQNDERFGDGLFWILPAGPGASISCSLVGLGRRWACSGDAFSGSMSHRQGPRAESLPSFSTASPPTATNTWSNIHRLDKNATQRRATSEKIKSSLYSPMVNSHFNLPRVDDSQWGLMFDNLVIDLMMKSTLVFANTCKY